MKKWRLAFIIIVVVLSAAVPVSAQTDDVSPDPAEGAETAVTITVIGQIVNETEGAETPANLEIMLHVWDTDFNDKDMVHSVADGDGRFVFDDVAYEPGLLYSVMASYQNANYFSPPMDVAAGETMLELDVPVYETTTDVSAVQVDGMHIFFDSDPDGLMVGEVYSLSNQGDRTVAGATALDDGTPATFRFDLPADAVNVTFQGSQSRFFLTSDGFADTAALLPGQRTDQIVVTYILPYTDGLTLNRMAVLPTSNVSVLLSPELGLTLQSENLVDNGRSDMGNGTVVDIFSLSNLAIGDVISLDLSGELTMSSSGPMAAEAPSTNPSGLALGGVLLGLATIGVGLWWYRRPADEMDEDFPEAFDDIVQEIALLDVAHEQQEIDDEIYQLQRAALREQAKVVLARSGD